jgi:hypothetical protein
MCVWIMHQRQIPVSVVVFQWFVLGRGACQWFVTFSNWLIVFWSSALQALLVMPSQHLFQCVYSFAKIYVSLDRNVSTFLHAYLRCCEIKVLWEYRTSRFESDTENKFHVLLRTLYPHTSISQQRNKCYFKWLGRLLLHDATTVSLVVKMVTPEEKCWCVLQLVKESITALPNLFCTTFYTATHFIVCTW